jgi:UMF1 family MFS transporter
LAITANVSFGVSVVCLNSYLPQLARNNDNVKEAYARLRVVHSGPNGSLRNEDADEEEPNDARSEERTLLTPRPREDSVLDAGSVGSASETYAKLVSRATSQISSKGIAIGYGAGIALLILLLIPVTLLKGSTFALRLSISLTGLWWMLFTIPAALWLPSFSSPDVDREAYVMGSIFGEIAQAWIRLGHMLLPSEMAKLRNTFWFLLAWFLLSDGASH